MPIPFTCPYCKTQTTVADEYGGQTGPCISCGKPVTIPYGGVPSGGDGLPRKRTSGWVVFLVVALCVVPILLCGGGLILALMLPAVQAASDAAERTNCLNNLKQIGLAMHQYHEQHDCFPPAYLADANGKPQHSWRVLILPYIDQELYDQYSFDEPWDGPNNAKLAGSMPEIFSCPSDITADTTCETSYVMVTGPGTVGDGEEAVSIVDVADGTSNTLLVVEMSGTGLNWLEPKDWDTSGGDFSVNGGLGTGIQSEHSMTAGALFCDGSVQGLEFWADVDDIKALTTIAGEEDVQAWEVID